MVVMFYDMFGTELRNLLKPFETLINGYLHKPLADTARPGTQKDDLLIVAVTQAFWRSGH